MISSKIILGSAQLGMPYGIANNKLKSKEEVFNILSVAKKKGIKYIDTANVYGEAENLIGEYNIKYGQHFKINTKFKGTEVFLEKQVFESLEKLNIESINTYFFHSFDDFFHQPKNQKLMENLKKNKIIDSIGLSIYTNDQFEKALNTDVDVIQIPFNVFDNWLYRGTYINKAVRKKKKIQIRSIFLQGLFFLKNLPENLIELKNPLFRLNYLSKKWNISIIQLLIGYITDFTEIDFILMGVDSANQLKDNMKYLGKSLPQELIEEIHQIKISKKELLLPLNW